MEAQLEQIREQQKESWNKFSPGWKKWDDLTMDFLKPMGDEIIRQLKPKDGELILDVAAGTGEPGMTIAEMIPKGKVVITDLSDGMLKVATENLKKRGLKNVEIKACDVTELPFPDNTFDAISCRMGFMFFPDMQLAANEMARVLKPGGRIATAVWAGPEKNFWVTVMAGTINRNMELPPPPPGAPGMFRCAQPGLIQELFKNAGLRHTSEMDVKGQINPQSTDTYWNMMMDVAAPFVSAMSNADDAMKAKIKKEVYQQLNDKFPDGKVNIECNAIVIYGEK